MRPMEQIGDLRYAIYARYSSAQQNPRSIEDQVYLCRARIEEDGGRDIAVYADRAETATSMRERTGLQQLLRDVSEERIDIVVAEALDRISRDLADLAWIHKRFRFRDIRLVTLEEGQVGPLHVSLKGAMAEEYVMSLAAKTRRGMEGVIRQGRAAGGLSYGYRVANRIGPDGQVLRGLREIDPDQAEIVLRIFRWYADGRSTRWIAGELNGAGVPAPRGGLWKASTINGNRGRRNGILQNELYRGQLLFGRTAARRDPDTGRRRSRAVPAEEWVSRDVPELRIVDEDLWTTVQLRRAAGCDRRTGGGPRAVRPLTPLIHCGVCGGRMTIHDRGRYVCMTRREGGACSNDRRAAAADIEQAAVQQLGEIVLWGADWISDLEAAGETVTAMRAEIDSEIAEKRARLGNLIETIELGERGDGVRNRVSELERAVAEARLRMQSLDAVPRELLPARALWSRLQERIAALASEAGSGDADGRIRAMLRIHDLIERIDVSPGDGPRAVRIEIHPRRNALIALAIAEGFEAAPGEPILRRIARVAA